MSTHGPIQRQYQEQMKALAAGIDEILNGDQKPKKVGFALLLFEFGETPTSDRINYLSTANREDTICALKEIVSRFEGRHIEETQTALPTTNQ